MKLRLKIIFFALFLVLNSYCQTDIKSIHAQQNNLQKTGYQFPSLGAIRWDAWTGSSNQVGKQVEKSLSPFKYHHRVPFFGIEKDSNSVSINGTFQEIMDQEIDYAAYAGLNYWAFVWYPSTSGLDKARKLYYSSTKKKRIKYCLIIENHNFVNGISINEIIQEFKDSSYFKVMNGRPLLYFLGYNGIRVTGIDALRSKTIASGILNPYLVELRVDGKICIVDSLRLDAFSMYAVTWIDNGVKYRELAKADIEQWNWMGITNKMKYIPHVTTGWDKRTRNENEPTWDKGIKPNMWVQMPSANELALHVIDAIDWVMTHPSIAEANTILIYAWNEHDEGGWLCPTLSNYQSTERIDTLRKKIQEYRQVLNN